MTLLAKIKADSLTARKLRLETTSGLTSLLGEIGSAEKKFNPARAITDDEIIPIIRKFISNNHETLAVLSHATGREDEIAKHLAENKLLESYLPVLAHPNDVEAVIRAEAATGAPMGKIMAALKAKFGTGYDAKAASIMVKSILAEAHA